MQAKTPTESLSILTHWSGASDSIHLGNVHGGVILKLMDECAAIASARHSHAPVVTAGFDRVSFLAPVHIGELVTITSVLTAAWRSSMEVAVKVEAELPRDGRPARHTCTAYVTMVAIDEQGRPVEIPPLRAQTPSEVLRMQEAELRRKNRLQERAQIEEGRVAETAHP